MRRRRQVLLNQAPSRRGLGVLKTCTIVENGRRSEQNSHGNSFLDSFELAICQGLSFHSQLAFIPSMNIIELLRYGKNPIGESSHRISVCIDLHEHLVVVIFTGWAPKHCIDASSSIWHAQAQHRGTHVPVNFQLYISIFTLASHSPTKWVHA